MVSKLYTDFDLTFKLNANGDISQLSDEDCIRQAILNAVHLVSFDIPFNEWYAANAKYYLFESADKITESELKKRLRDVLLFDSRLKDPQITVTYNDVNNAYFCIIDIVVYVEMLNRDISEQIKFERKR